LKTNFLNLFKILNYYYQGKHFLRPSRHWKDSYHSVSFLIFQKIYSRKMMKKEFRKCFWGDGKICISEKTFWNIKIIFWNDVSLIQILLPILEYKLILEYNFCILEFSFHNLFHTPNFLLRNHNSVTYFLNPIFENTHSPFYKTQEKIIKPLTYIVYDVFTMSPVLQLCLTGVKSPPQTLQCTPNLPPPETFLCTSFFSNI